MFCTFCECIIDNIQHYRSELHSENVKRKIDGLPTISADDFHESLQSKIPMTKEKCTREIQENTITNNCKKCLFCEEKETNRHYLEHGLSYEQINYIKMNKCYTCYESFISKDALLSHLEQGEHRSAVTDGTSLYLSDGTVLHPQKKVFEQSVLRPIIAPAKNIGKERISPAIAKKLDIREYNDLKCCLFNNTTYRKKII